MLPCTLSLKNFSNLNSHVEQSSGHHFPLHPILADSSLHPQCPLGSSRKWGRKPRLPCGAGTHIGVSWADLRVVHGHPGLSWPEPRVIATAHGVSSCLCPCSEMHHLEPFSVHLIDSYSVKSGFVSPAPESLPWTLNQRWPPSFRNTSVWPYSIHHEVSPPHLPFSLDHALLKSCAVTCLFFFGGFPPPQWFLIGIMT